MDGDDDMTPDFYIGRLPVRTLIEANIVVDKIKNYEMTPPLVPTFYQMGCTRHTSKNVRARMFQLKKDHIQKEEDLSRQVKMFGIIYWRKGKM